MLRVMRQAWSPRIRERIVITVTPHSGLRTPLAKQVNQPWWSKWADIWPVKRLRQIDRALRTLMDGNQRRILWWGRTAWSVVFATSLSRRQTRSTIAQNFTSSTSSATRRVKTLSRMMMVSSLQLSRKPMTKCSRCATCAQRAMLPWTSRSTLAGRYHKSHKLAAVIHPFSEAVVMHLSGIKTLKIQLSHLRSDLGH